MGGHAAWHVDEEIMRTLPPPCHCRRQAKGTGSAGATADATVQLAVPGRKSVDLPAAAAGGAAGDVEAGAGGVGGRGGARTVRVSAGSEVRCTDSPHSTSRVPLKEGFKPDSAQ